MSYASTLRATQKLKDWPGNAKTMSADAAAEIELAKIRGGYRKSDPICKICFCKINTRSKIHSCY